MMLTFCDQIMTVLRYPKVLSILEAPAISQISTMVSKRDGTNQRFGYLVTETLTESHANIGTDALGTIRMAPKK